MSKQTAGTKRAESIKLRVWWPKTDMDYLHVFEHGPVSCMKLSRNQCFYNSDEEFNETFSTRWNSEDFYYKDWHPGLFYHDCPSVQIMCLIGEDERVYGRANIWCKALYGSLYGQYLDVFRNYLTKVGIMPITLNYKPELPLYSIPGRHIQIGTQDHYLLPWAFCDDWINFANRPYVGFDDATKRFLVSTKPIPDGLQIKNDYAFNGFISNWDIKTKWSVPKQSYVDARKRTADDWNSLL